MFFKNSREHGETLSEDNFFLKTEMFNGAVECSYLDNVNSNRSEILTLVTPEQGKILILKSNNCISANYLNRKGRYFFKPFYLREILSKCNPFRVRNPERVKSFKKEPNEMIVLEWK